MSDQDTPWTDACAALQGALDWIADHRTLTEEQLIEARGEANRLFGEADRHLKHLLAEYAPTSPAYSQVRRCIQQIHAWVAPIRAWDRSVPFRIFALRDAVRLWLPDRRRVERHRHQRAA